MYCELCDARSVWSAARSPPLFWMGKQSYLFEDCKNHSGAHEESYSIEKTFHSTPQLQNARSGLARFAE
jgi:hypothetical protein